MPFSRSLFRFFSWLCFFGASLGPLSAQSLRSFTAERSAYLQDLEQFLNDNNKLDKEEELQPTLNRFSEVWLSAAVTPEAEQQIYRLSDLFLRKRLNRFEDWQHFLELIEHLVTAEEAGSLAPFLVNLEEVARQTSRESSEYLRTVHGVFYKNVLFDDGRLRWAVRGSVPEYRMEEGAPVFYFEDIDVQGFYKDDSTSIEGTRGRFYPRQYRFEGQEGQAFFTRAELTRDSAYVELRNYQLRVQKPDFKADSVTLHTVFYLDRPIDGSFEEKLTSQGGRRNATFPRFRSYRSDLFIPYMLPDAQYRGGFSIMGSRFYGGGNDSNSRATLQFMYNDTLLIKASSPRYWLRPDKVYSEDVEVSIYLRGDSIYHPKVTMRYLPEEKRFSLIRKDEGMGSAVFSNTYHNFDMRFELLNWDIGSPKMSLGNINMGADEPVVFESKNYFRERRFKDIQGMSRRSPLVTLQKLIEANDGQREYSSSDIAYNLKMDQSDAHIFMMRMAILGFIDYSVAERRGIVKDKVFEYIYNMRGIRDYDVIQFVSKVSQNSNAVLSLESANMEVEGIEVIALSDSQKVNMYPYGQKITLRKGNDFDFDGRINAGRFNFWGKDFKFDYEGFRVAMTDIDSMRFKVISFEPNSLGQRYLVDVKTVLQDLTGDLQIDKPNNKSSKASYSEYPIFTSGKSSYIYYDKPSIFGGVYERERFYVTLAPFEIDSLDNARTSSLSFDGVLTSAGIFPEIEEPIKVQPDYSLGFTKQTPTEGLAAYGGKGRFSQSLSLSNQGLRGDGRIDYLHSVAQGEEFVFFPDSTKGLVADYHIDEKLTGASNPEAVGSDLDLRWLPYQDVLYTSTRERPIALYAGAPEMDLSGTLAHRPSGLGGRGLCEFLNAETRSQDYRFEARKLLSPASAFRLRAHAAANWGFGLENARTEIDFSAQRGYFTLNDPAQSLSFTANQYEAFMDYARWLIPEKSIEVERKGGAQLAEMLSVHPQQDSLRFMAEKAKFSLEHSLLEAFAVPEMEIADAVIFPDTGYVAIDSAADMRKLKNAALTASRENGFHQFYGANIKVSGALKYRGSADYEYLDQDATPWPIHFEELHADTGYTVGTARIKQEESFYLSPYFGFYGQARLDARREFLDFRGYTHIEADCPAISTNWFEFRSIIDPSNIAIELPEYDPDDMTKSLANGVYLAADTISGYAAFLSQEVRPSDKQMFYASGILYYDEGLSAYLITSSERLKDQAVADNVLRFYNLDCTMEGEGELSLDAGNSQLDIRSYGIIYYDLSTDAMSLDLVMTLDFFFDKGLQDQWAQLLLQNRGSGGVELGRDAFSVGLKHAMAAKDREKLETELSEYGLPESVPKSFRHSLVFGKLALEWTPESISFLSSGSIGLLAIDDQFVNIQSEGYFELQRKRRGDEMYLYLDLGSEDFYLDYRRNMMGIYSSNEAFMDALKALDIKDRRKEVRGLPPFSFGLSTKGKRNRFLRRFEQITEEE